MIRVRGGTQVRSHIFMLRKTQVRYHTFTRRKYAGNWDEKHYFLRPPWLIYGFTYKRRRGKEPYSTVYFQYRKHRTNTIYHLRETQSRNLTFTYSKYRPGMETYLNRGNTGQEPYFTTQEAQASISIFTQKKHRPESILSHVSMRNTGRIYTFTGKGTILSHARNAGQNPYFSTQETQTRIHTFPRKKHRPESIFSHARNTDQIPYFPTKKRNTDQNPHFSKQEPQTRIHAFPSKKHRPESILSHTRNTDPNPYFQTQEEETQTSIHT
jgi:hypothetical protein